MQNNQILQIGSLINAPIPGYEERKFQIIEVLGKGSEGAVYQIKAISWGINDQKKLALKIQNQFKPEEILFIDKLIAYQNQYENNLDNQINQSILPSNIIRIFDKFQWNGKVILIMEAGEQDLFKYLSKTKFLNYKDKIKIALQISYSINFLHQNKQLHRDIKPENFIKVNDQFKLIDFGLTKVNKGAQMSVLVGTPLFQAPEILQGKSDYTQAVDIWSLACVFYELFSGNPIIQVQSYSQLKETILNCEENKFIDNQIASLNACDQIKSLLTSMLQFQFDKRIKIEQVIEKLQAIYQCNNIVNNVPKPNFIKNQQQFSFQNAQQIQKVPFNENIQRLEERIKQFDENQQSENKIIKDLIQSLLSKNELGFQDLQSIITNNNEKQISIYQDEINKCNRKIDVLQNDFKDYSQKQLEIEKQLQIKERVIQDKEDEIASLNQRIIQQQSDIQNQEMKLSQLQEQLQIEKNKIIDYENMQNLNQEQNEQFNQIDKDQSLKDDQKNDFSKKFTVYQKCNLEKFNENQTSPQNQIKQFCIEIIGLLQLLNNKLFDPKISIIPQASQQSDKKYDMLAKQIQLNLIQSKITDSITISNIQEVQNEIQEFKESNENICHNLKILIMSVEKQLIQIWNQYQHGEQLFQYNLPKENIAKM